MSLRDSQEDIVMDDQADAEEASGTLSFSLLLDKSLPSLVVIAAWNPGKDLLAMVTMDHQLIVHRLNWQRLWAVSPDLTVSAICWRPDGKALAVGHINGSIAIHDVENGEVLRKTETHQVAVECLYWAEEGQNITDNEDEVFLYEDRTPRFFPPPPKPPPMPGTAPSFDMSSVLGSAVEEQRGSSLKGATQDVKHGLDVLCSGDQDGVICLSAFGVFPIGRLDIRELVISDMGCGTTGEKKTAQLLDASALQVSLSSDLRHMTVVCAGTSTVDGRSRSTDAGNYCISVNTCILGDRRKELRQVALQASSIEELIDVLQTSLAVMEKLWSDAITAVQKKFNGFTQLLREHGSNVSPQDELLGLLTCGYASPALHQFLAASVGEGGLKRLAKSIDTASKELYSILSEHMQPAAEIIAFRLGELRGLARWQTRLACAGLEESLINQALEHASMLLVQLERLLRLVSETTGGFRLFFVWLLKALRQLNRESLPQAETLPNVDSMAVANFLQTDFEKDPIGLHLSNSSSNVVVDVPKEVEELMEEVARIGGFEDSRFLQRTLAQQIERLTTCCQEAFAMPLKVVSPQLGSPCMILLCNTATLSTEKIPVSSTYFEMKRDDGLLTSEDEDELLLTQYICFQVNDRSSQDNPSVVGIVRGFRPYHAENDKRILPEAVALQLDASLRCSDIALYKQRQLVLLVTEKDPDSGKWTGQTWVMLLQLDELPFQVLDASQLGNDVDLLQLCSTKGPPSEISLSDGKVRALPQSDVVRPLAVSASRGLACVFTSQRRVFLYDLEEDEEGKDEDME